jgi:hypothetical protein
VPCTDCGGTCVSLDIDSQHCGACDKACAAGQICTGGACKVSCATGQKVCGAACIDVRHDPKNCGDCSHACGDAEACVQGVCVQTCQAPNLSCDGGCVDPASDKNNCASCGHVCGANQYCDNSTCADKCPAPLTQCSTGCVDLKSDRNNCNACGMACTVNQFCEGSICVDKCPAALARCNGSCVDLHADSNNCNACGAVCPGGTRCSNGACVCAAGFVSCVAALYLPDGGADGGVDAGTDGGSDGGGPVPFDGGAPKCVDTANDRTNCGGCNLFCPPDLACVGSACKPLGSCADWVAKEGPLADGDYKIQPGLPDGGSLKPFTVYCKGMQTTAPTEYLAVRSEFTIDGTGALVPVSNFVRYGPGGACPCTEQFFRIFSKIRLQVPSLVVTTSDLTFSVPSEPSGCWYTAAGACGGAVTLPYGNAANCNFTQAQAGTMTVDLRGTSFTIDPSVTWVITGAGPYGTSSVTVDRKQAQATGGGFCGGNGPQPALKLKQD